MRSDRQGRWAAGVLGRWGQTPTSRATKRPSYRSTETGMSLVEATIILMVIGMLTAVIAPAIGDYVRDAQEAAAKRDTEAIAAALSRMLDDVGEAWFVRNGARTGSATSHGAPAHGTGTRVDMLVSDGAAPTVATARPAGSDWDDAVDHAAVQTLENYLVLNRPSGAAGNAYRDATTMTGSGNFDPDEGRGGNANFAWRGAYLPGPIGPDPWGNRYGANVEFLARAQGTTGSGSRMDVFVVSAGSDWEVDTAFEVDGLVAADDDLATLVSGATR